MAAAAESTQNAELLDLAHRHMQVILARNPMDNRAVSRSAEYARELAASGRITREEGLRPALLLVELMPGFWQSHATLAWSYVRLEEYDSALAAVTRARELDNETANAALIYYIEAFTLNRLGRTEEALLGDRDRYEGLGRRDTLGAMERTLLDDGWLPDQAAVLVGLLRSMREGDRARVTGDLSTLLDREPTDFATFAAEHAAAWQV
jgi:tetratricopeptide (TPR) repeat protein